MSESLTEQELQVSHTILKRQEARQSSDCLEPKPNDQRPKKRSGSSPFSLELSTLGIGLWSPAITFNPPVGLGTDASLCVRLRSWGVASSYAAIVKFETPHDVRHFARLRGIIDAASPRQPSFIT